MTVMLEDREIPFLHIQERIWLLSASKKQTEIHEGNGLGKDKE